MGAGAGGDSGAFPAIQADVPAPQEDGSVAAAARRMEALAAATLEALAEEGPQGDALRVHLARQWQEAAIALAKADIQYRAGLADGRAECPVPIPPQRKPGGHRRPPGDHPHLKRVKGWAFPPAVFAALRHALHHGPVAKLVAVPGAKAAAAIATAGTVAAVGAVAVVTLAGPSHAGAGASGSTGAPAPAASIVGAVPFPSSTPIALSGVHPKAKRAGSGKDPVLSGSGVLPPPYVPATSGPPSASSPPPSSAAPAGPAVLTVSTTAIDLSGSLTSETITLSASGSGWVSWKVDTTDPQTGAAQSDLDFSATHGVLQAGQSVTVTVSLDATQDGAVSETFMIGGVSVRVTLPAPVVAPTPAATGSPSPAPTANPT